ncbi:MAG: PAAR domain-containing protein [Proteobacteria bacterium]|nr:PAAR domain-containing protein [Pseudomonadota bacterium]
MAKRAIIRLGDPTSHGGTVQEAFPALTIYGKPAAGLGHRGYCPQCKRDFVIVAGARNFRYLGKNIAVEGMQTSCGAMLIATQRQASIDDSPDSRQFSPVLTLGVSLPK